MHLLIIKNGHILAWTESDGSAEEYSLMTLETIPEYPQDGKTYELDLVNGEPAWVVVQTKPTLQEQIDELKDRLDGREKEWKPGEAVYSAYDTQNPNYGTADRRHYDGIWYICRQSHVTQADWTPDRVPALWGAE